MFIAGNQIEVVTYLRPHSTTPVKKSQIRKTDPADSLASSLSRSRRVVRRLVHSNAMGYADTLGIAIPPRFLTLTFAKNVVDFSAANYEFKKFVTRLNEANGFPSRYLVVPERQKRGAVHYHQILFNQPYRSTFVKGWFQNLWGNGFIRYNTITDPNAVSHYVEKYLYKTMRDRPAVGRGARRYYPSKGLKKPVSVRDERLVGLSQDLLHALPSEVCTRWVNTEPWNNFIEGYARYELPFGYTVKLNPSPYLGRTTAELW